MERCLRCGSANPAGALFCSNCGANLPDEHGSTSGETAAPAEPLPARCNRCGNDVHLEPGMLFCRSCGAKISDALPAPQGKGRQRNPSPTPVVAETQTCPRCSGATPAGYMFCQRCGAALPTMSGPTPLANMPMASRGAVVANNPLAARPTQAESAVGGWARLVSINRDGADGTTYHLSGAWMDVGKGAVDVSISEDPYLAYRHARFERREGRVTVSPIDVLNGVFRRRDVETPLMHEDVILVGREILRFELLSAMERNPTALTRHGVQLFASPPRNPWGRLLQLEVNGGIGDVRHLASAQITLGREEGDVIFPDDEFMSRRHAQLRFIDGVCMLKDLGSSNGTFVQLREPTTLTSGDRLRLGDQMFRFESL